MIIENVKTSLFEKYQKNVSSFQNFKSNADDLAPALACEVGIGNIVCEVEDQLAYMDDERALKVAMAWVMGMIHGMYSYMKEVPQRFLDGCQEESAAIHDEMFDMLDEIDRTWQINVCEREKVEPVGEDGILPFERILRNEFDKALTSIEVRRESLENKMAYEMGNFSALLNMAEANREYDSVDLQNDLPACYDKLEEIAQFLTAVDGVWYNHFG